ncbi:MAG: hypothetical protein WCY84_04295 [Candidatus Cloacimonadaceae bacterium]
MTLRKKHRIAAWIILLSLFALLLSSCTGGFGITEEQKLQTELKRWENFSGSGIIELNAMGMSLRKNFSLAKSLKDLRLDVLDGGLLGSAAAPSISLYLGDYLALESPMMPALEALNLKDKIPGGVMAFFATSEYLVEKYGEEIIRDKALVREDFRINFNPKNYQIESVMSGKSGSGLNVKYTGQGQLDSIEIKSNMPVSAKLYFDSVKYHTPNIIPLPQKESDLNLMDMLKDILKP